MKKFTKHIDHKFGIVRSHELQAIQTKHVKRCNDHCHKNVNKCLDEHLKSQNGDKDPLLDEYVVVSCDE